MERDGMAMQSKRLTLFAMMIAVGIMSAFLLMGVAAAQEKDSYAPNGPKILPSVIERDEPQRPDAVSPERITPPNTPPEERGPLPFTGADLTLFVSTGLAAVATGSVIVRRTRSRNFQ